MTRNSDPMLVLGDIDMAGLNDLPVVDCQKGHLSFHGKRIRIPAGRLDVAEALVDGSIDAWNGVVDWLAQRLGPHQVLLVAHDDLLRDVAILGSARGLFRYALAYPHVPKRIFARDYHAIGNATFCLLPDAKAEAEFRQSYVAPYRGVLVGAGRSAIADIVGQDAVRPKPRPPSAPIRVLLVAYFSGQARTVGVQRVNYWRTGLPRLAPDIAVTLATANTSETGDEGIRIVPDHGPASLIAADGSVPDWASAFVESEKRNAKCFSTLAYYWRIALERHFDATDDEFDVIIMSGNPFAFFDFAAYAKRRWSARVILDYRDPFANNPRMAYTPDARDWARYIEKGYNLQADVVAVVNEACVELVESLEDVEVLVVPNGFDETAIGPAGPRWSDDDGRVHFVHAGTIFHDRSPKSLIQALDPERHVLHHIGTPTGIDSEDQAHAAVRLYGPVPYVQASAHISRADCGIVFLSESGFETPTKLYDYLAHGLDVLMITHGRKEGSSIEKILGGVDGIYWASNTPESLRDFVSTYTPRGKRRSGDVTSRYSRRAGTDVLAQHIRGLCGHGRDQAWFDRY